MSGRHPQTWTHLAMAIGLFWAGPALAQGPTSTIIITEGPVQPFRADDLEAAWLADPITFPHALRAVPSGRTLEIHGTVSSQAARIQAVNIATIFWQGPVLDRIVLKTGESPAPSPLSPSQMQAVAAARVRSALPHLAASVHLECDSDTRLVATGTCRSIEDKRALVQVLRSMPGCTSFVNEVKVEVPGNVPAAVVPKSAVPPPVVPVSAERPVATPAAPITQAKLPTSPAGQFPRPVVNERTELMRQAIRKTLPRARDVRVNQLGPQHFQIQLVAPNEDEGTTYANRLFSLELLQRLHLDVLVHVPR